ncbi:hypothetical protein [Mesorhizobium sp. B2-4-17]|uniref:hypothetical protein n=1 Tax=Mesorhizobium sp. B2-4-17 TaxID=2589932 RepID=UPI0011261F6D|nr:hypothetical protein [Mesorhizobium sp. B2-4-17]TPK92604.1 hypothetical protein FJ548_01695 [Mesorhizobium sp. B2-4-17]
MTSTKSVNISQVDRYLVVADRLHPTCFILGMVFIVVLGVSVFLISPTVIMAPWDIFILLDGGWRILSGQVPHHDFYTPVGPLVYWLSALGMYVAGPSLKGIACGILIFFAFIAPWAMAVYFRKLPTFYALVLTLFTALLIVATRPLGYLPSTTTYAMIYNRYAWVLLSILVVQLFLQDQKRETNIAIFDASSAGLLLGLLFICKISFLPIGVTALAIACLLRPDIRKASWLTIVGFGAVCFVATLAGHLSLQEYWSDLSFAAKAQSLGLRFVWFKNSLISNALSVLLLVLCWFALIAVGYWRKTVTLADAIKSSLVFWFLLASAMLITIGNASEGSDVPLFLVAGIILLVETRRTQTVQSERSSTIWSTTTYRVSAVAIITLFLGGTSGRDFLSIVQTHSLTAMRDDAVFSKKFDASRLQDFTIPATSEWQTAYSRAGDVPDRINEGLGLLRRHVSAKSHIVTLALTDPFSFALDIAPSRGDPLWWDLGISFKRSHYPSSERVFMEADYVIYPLTNSQEGCCQQTVVALLDIYGGFLKEHFIQTDRSAHWVLLRRRDLM